MSLKRRWLEFLIYFLLLPILLGAKTYEDSRGQIKQLIATAQEEGDINVLLKIAVNDIHLLTANSRAFKVVTPGQKFPRSGLEADAALERAIHNTTDNILFKLNGRSYHVNHTYNTIPFLALSVSAETLDYLSSLPEILDIYEDRPSRLIEPVPTIEDKKDVPFLAASTELIGAEKSWNMGYDGSGWYVAILDTGIRRTHQFFAGKQIIEACFSAKGHCPNNSNSMYGKGSAAHHSSTYSGFDHGTHVTGIAAGKYGSLSGVAKESNIIAIQVFSRFGPEECSSGPCVMSYHSDQVKALEYIYSKRSQYSIASVNMSLGSGSYRSYCNNEPQKAAIDNLKAVRIATIIATGNSYTCGAVSSPACIEPAIAVGASSKNDTEAIFNNWHATLQELFSPGVAIYSATGESNSSYSLWSGTSMATPHVAGAWALIRQAKPNSSVNAILNALTNTGTPIVSPYCGSTPIPRPNVDEAILELGGGQTGGSEIITLNRNQLNFSGVVSSNATGSQVVWLNNEGNGTMNWSAAANSSWLTCLPTSGTDNGVISVSVDHSGLSAGTYSGSINITSPDASNSPQTVTVNLTVINSGQDQPPFGIFATPISGSSMSGSIPVTGWALDDVGIQQVQIFNGSTYIGEAFFVAGARPDVEQSYPFYPNNYKAGWGYMLLTHFLPGGGNGTYTLNAKAIDLSGKTVTLGSKTITIDNNNAVKPFGAIDTPAQGGSASGKSFVNWGWVLTPFPNSIPTDGSTIHVWVNGIDKSHPTYNVYRSDIAGFFPGLLNSNGAAGYFHLDTTKYPNGVHTIQWTATDSNNNTDGIGSRYFTIQNTGANTSQNKSKGHRYFSNLPEMKNIQRNSDPVLLKKGFNKTAPLGKILPDDKGMITIRARELDRLEIQLSTVPIHTKSKDLHIIPTSPLPIGASLDTKTHIFYWQLGPGFVGTYQLDFLTTGPAGTTRKRIRIKIEPLSD
jgi:subtilisin family serine protease